jgi:hypothetical protein
MSHHGPPTQFTGKTWVFVVQALVVGGLATFSLTLGPLFLFQILKDANGQPATDAGVALTIMSVPLLLLVALAVFNIAARRRPLLRVCREGLAINMIGSSSVGGIPLVPGVIRVAWLILSFQGFKQQVLFVPWQSLGDIGISGPPLAQTLTIVGSMFRADDGQIRQTTLVANQISFRDAAFKSPLEQILGSINAYWQNAESRNALPSWNG